MTITVCAFVARLPHLTPAAFKEAYEQHILLIKALFGDVFPTVNRRHYTSPDRTGMPGRGPESVPEYDVYTLNVYRDQQHFDGFMQRYAQVFETIDIDEKRFIDQSKLRFARLDGVEQTFADTVSPAHTTGAAMNLAGKIRAECYARAVQHKGGCTRFDLTKWSELSKYHNSSKYGGIYFFIPRELGLPLCVSRIEDGASDEFIQLGAGDRLQPGAYMIDREHSGPKGVVEDSTRSTLIKSE